MKHKSRSITFGEFVDIYLEAISIRIKMKSYINKKSILDKYILPHFRDRKLDEITNKDILEWLDAMAQTTDPRTGCVYSKSYIKTMNAHMRAVMNYAEKYYDAKAIMCENELERGHEAETEIKTWTPAQYRMFAEAMMEKPFFFYIFETMYWCGLKANELLALTPDDIDLVKKEISITKTLQQQGGKDFITPPKMLKSKRAVTIPGFLCNELKDYIDYIYRPAEDGRLFPTSKSNLIYAMKRGAEKACLPEIGVCGLRCSYELLLAYQGFRADVSDKPGHNENAAFRDDYQGYRYSQAEIADRLNAIKKGWFDYEK